MTMDRIKWEPVDLSPLQKIQQESLRLSRSTATPKSTDSVGDAPPADIAQPAADLAVGLLGQLRTRPIPPTPTGISIPSGQPVPSSTAKMEPSVRIEARCKNGHETYLYPEECVGLDLGTIYVEWECARCPKDDFKCEVRL